MIRQIHVDACESTQDLIKEQTPEGSETILVSTNSQQKGRGRGTNTWLETSGTVCFSLSLEPHRVLSFTALEISLLISRFFEIEGCKISLKWPNDLWDSQQLKCGGILIQGSGSNFFAGVGINLFSDRAEFGGVYREGFELDKKSWSLKIARYLIANRYSDTAQLKKDWEERCTHLGRRVSITENSEVSEGIFLGLGEAGEARLMTAHGTKNFYNGTLRIIESD